MGTERAAQDVGRPLVVVCRGGTCRKAEGHDELRAELSAVAEVVTSSCLDVCKGPVVAVEPDGPQPVVLSKVRSPKARRDLRNTVACGAHLTSRLDKRLVRKKKARKAVARALKALDRHRR